MFLDNVVYRLGLAKSRAQARQFVQHGFINVNGKTMGLARSRAQARQFVQHGFINVNGKTMSVPSYSMKVGDKVSFSQRGNSISQVKEILDGLKSEYVPAWLSLEEMLFHR